MATVPVYQPRVQEQALQGGFQQAPDVGGPLQRAGQALMQVSEVADRIDLRDAQAKANEIDAKITTEWLRWDAENRPKFRGQNVDGYAPAAEAWWKKTAEEAGKDLNPRARTLASQSLVRKQQSALGSVLQFTGAEKERHADEAAAANISSTIQFGVSTGQVTGAAQQVRDQVAQLGARKGWTTEQVQAEQVKNLSALHLAQVTKLAERDANAARAYYDANKAEVVATAQARIEEVLTNEADNQFATAEAAKLASLPLAEQLAKAAEITDPKRREKTLQQVKQNHVMVREAQREVEERASDAAWQAFAKGAKIPESTLVQMNGRERAQLVEAQRTRADRLAAGRPVKTDMATYIDVREKLARGERVDLRGYTEKIGTAQMEQLLDIQAAARKPGKQDDMLTDEQRINVALRGLGIDPKKKPDEAGRVMTEIDRRVRAASSAKGDKPLTPDEKQKIVDDVAKDTVYVSEFFTDPQKPVALLTPEEQAKAYVRVDGRNVPVSSVPASDRRQIIAALRATGRPVSEQNIVQLYVDGKKSNRTAQGPVK
jgi:hypothetical protein